MTEPRVIPELTFRLPDGAMLVTVEAPYGREVVVEGSEDLETWQEVGRDPCDRGEFEVYHEQARAAARDSTGRGKWDHEPKKSS